MSSSLRRRTATVVLCALWSLFIVACSKPSNTAVPEGPAPQGDITIVQRDSKFVVSELTVPAGRDITIVVENQDKKTAHNIRFPTLPGNPKTALQVGPRYQTITVRFDKPGVYPFQCDPHVSTMVGRIIAV